MNNVLTFEYILDKIYECMYKGLNDDCFIYLSHFDYDILTVERTKLVTNGIQHVVLHGLNGHCDIQPSIYIKKGYMVIASRDGRKVFQFIFEENKSCRCPVWEERFLCGVNE